MIPTSDENVTTTQKPRGKKARGDELHQSTVD